MAGWRTNWHQLAVTRLAVILTAAYPAGLVVLTGSFETSFQETPPELVVEVAPPWTRLYDRNRKKDVYEGFGIPVYWIVEPDLDQPSLTVFELRSGTYEQTAHVIGDQESRSTELQNHSFQNYSFVNTEPSAQRGPHDVEA